jgi:uncharacterized repeat protein (TIGR03803 family)
MYRNVREKSIEAENHMHTTSINRALTLTGLAPAGKLNHTYCDLLPLFDLFVARLGKLNRRKRPCAVLALCAATAIALPAQTFTTLFTFDGTNGGGPGPLVQATNGHLYGTTCCGGPASDGTVFEIAPSGALTNLHSFHGTEGYSPAGVLVQAANGDFYGTTSSGGANGQGTVFKIAPSGKLTTLYSFCSQSGCPDGQSPGAGLVLAGNGNFYGTTGAGGAGLDGTIFEITPGGALTTLHSFGGTDGNSPSSLVQATDGSFYGIALFGGNYGPCPPGCGTIYKITPSGTFTTVYNFCSQSGCADGSAPEGLMHAANGDFYGTTDNGGANGGIGTVFKITPSGILTTLYSFCAQSGCTDGDSPNGGLVQASNGNFYGTTLDGGAHCAPYGCGTIFEITPSGKLATLHRFDGTDGSFPAAAMIQDTNGMLYGTTGGGGQDNWGTVFSVSVGLGPFVKTQTTSGKVGAGVEILGTGLTGATSVSFNGTAAFFQVVSSSFIAAKVPAGATSGKVEVVTLSGTLSTYVPYRVKP